MRIADVGSTILSLQQCIEAIHGWCASRRLQLNPSKTEVIWFGTKANLKKMENTNLTLHVGNDVIDSVSSVRDLGVLLDNELSMKTHISKTASVCYFHLRRLKTVRRILAGHADDRQFGHCFCHQSSGLLQFCTCGAAEVEHCAIATCTECRCETDLCSRSA